MNEPKTITRCTYLTTLALFTLAQSHYRRSEEFLAEIAETLGLERFNHIEDAVFENAGHGDLDEAMRKAKITVEPQS